MEVREEEHEMQWHRLAVGGMWDVIGKLQFEFMVAQGLRPHHQLLDIGCGSLRGGVHFISYLDAGHYVGVDRDADLLAAGREHELTSAVVEAKAPVFAQMDDFAFDSLGRQYDYAMAQSVFTHLPLNSIQRCLVNADRVLVPDGGTLYATFFLNPFGPTHLDPVPLPALNSFTYPDRDPYHYVLETFEFACRGTGLHVEHLGEWNHPRGQQMLAFRKQ